MIEILTDSLVPYTNSIEPALKMTVRVKYKVESIIMKVEGNAFAEDNRFIGSLVELIPSRRDELQVLAKRPYDRNPVGEASLDFDFTLTMNKRTIDYVEELRAKNPKKNVVLRFTLTATYLQPRLELGSYRWQNSGQQMGNTQILIREDQGRYYGDQTLNILVTDINSRLFSLSFETLLGTIQTIRSSDWVQDFQKPLGIGNFLIVEVPKLEFGNLESIKLSGEEEKFKQRLDRAFEILPLIEKDLREGEWESVVKRTRDLLELFKKDMSQFIKTLVSETSSMSEEKAGDLTQAVDRLYEYSSDLHHTVNKDGKTNEFFTGGKEDAYMAYLLSTSLVNLLTKKFLRITTK